MKLTNQLARFVRVAVVAAAPGVLAMWTGQGPVTIVACASLAGAALEVAWRAVHPTVAAATPPPARSSTSTSAEPFRPV